MYEKNKTQLDIVLRFGCFDAIFWCIMASFGSYVVPMALQRGYTQSAVGTMVSGYLVSAFAGQFFWASICDQLRATKKVFLFGVSLTIATQLLLYFTRSALLFGLLYICLGFTLYNIYNFATCPIEHLVEDGQRMSLRQLLKMPILGVAIILMICAGASEMAMAQWASAFAESALGLTKSVGDLAGPCLFAITMGIARVLYGKFGEKIDLTKFMLVSGVLCVLSYLLAGLSAMPILGLIGCILCGFSVGIMWPGSISITVPRIPKGGTTLFALLAVAGDMGGAFGPSMVGYFSQQAGDNLQVGLLTGCAFPLIMLAALIAMRKMAKND